MVAFIQLLKNYNENKAKLEFVAPDTLNAILVLGVDDCDEIHRKIGHMGGRIHRSPFDNSVNGRDDKKIKMRSMFAWDPDNIFLEINQRT